MKNSFVILALGILMLACTEKVGVSSVDLVNWSKRMVELNPNDSLTHGASYLSVYSEIYSQTEHRTHDLTATVSMRNTSKTDTIFIKNAEYFNTKGTSIRTYFNKTIFILPMETVEIIIDEKDQSGGTGANFIFEWAIKPNTNEPIFEGIMISTSGAQGLSFTTQGKKLK